MKKAMCLAWMLLLMTALDVNSSWSRMADSDSRYGCRRMEREGKGWLSAGVCAFCGPLSIAERGTRNVFASSLIDLLRLIPLHQP